MTSQATLRQTIENYLAATSNVPEIAWENAAFTPPKNAPWLRAKLDMTQNVGGVGVGAPMITQGALRLIIYVPEAMGANGLDASYDTLMTRFASGTVIGTGANAILCRTLTRGRAASDAPWYSGSLDIAWTNYSF